MCSEQSLFDLERSPPAGGVMRLAISIVTLLISALLNLPQLRAETRVALVVGNGAYQHTARLANPGNDARDTAAARRVVGFDVTEALDADKRGFERALKSFTDKLAAAEVALLFYAGHGLQVGQENWLVPVDARLERERDLAFEAVKLDFVLQQMEIDRQGKTSIILLDACRDNPLAKNLARSMGTRSAAIGKGLAAASTGLGTFIAYATQPGAVALDGEGTRNSPFTAALLKQMRIAGRNLPATMIEVRKEVVAATGGRQVPWDHSALTGDFHFVPGTPAAARPTPTPGAPTSADVTVLQERLRKLEEDAKRRERAAASPQPPAAATLPPVNPKPRVSKEPDGFVTADNVRIEGLKLSEKRQPNPEACREACQEQEECVAYQHGRRAPVMGQCQLFARVDARQEDQQWRSGVRASAALPAEGVALQSPPRRLSSEIKVPPGRKENGFDIYDGLDVMGDQIKMSTADSPAGCQIVCRNTPGCQAAVYNDFFRGKNVACKVFLDISSTRKTPSATLMVRSQ